MPDVLIVEDELLLLGLLRDGLDEAGFVVHEAANALVAFEMLHRYPSIALVVTDIGLPGSGDGRDLADYLRATRPKLPILFVTGGQVDTHAGIEVLTKPFTIDALVTTARRLVDAADATLATVRGGASRDEERS